MPRLKRTRDEAELDIQIAPDVPPQKQELLSTLRNMWEFASFMQYLYLFGSAVKVDNDFDMEDFEAECLRPSPSEKLVEIGLQLLKYVSSHRGLTVDLFDEYTRRQYLAKAPERNPFGENEEPIRFNDLDILARIRVLHQLSTWTLWNADRMRGMVPEDEDQLAWRMEPLGWDQEDRAYYVLDDNRLYRRTDQPIPPPSPKRKSKSKARASKKSRTRGTRASKRQKIEESDDEANGEDAEAGLNDDTIMDDADKPAPPEEPGYGFTGKTWECVAITLEEYRDLLATFHRSRDPNEKLLRKRIEDDVMPTIEKREEALRQKQLKKMRELENLQKMATAKRSSRLAGKAEREKQEQEEREAEQKRQQELRAAIQEQERQRKIEEGHESRRVTREQRLKEREAKRILHQEELARIEEQATRASSQEPNSDAAAGTTKRVSDRQLKTQREQHQIELDRLAEEEENWVFDCAVCGVHGENLDDGTHSVACEKCNVWQHSKCHGFSPKQAESDGFHFVCGTCKRKEEEAKRPKVAPLKLKTAQASSSPPAETPVQSKKAVSTIDSRDKPRSSGLPDHIQRQLDHVAIPPPPAHIPSPHSTLIPNGSPPRAYGQPQPGQYRLPPVSNFAPQQNQGASQAWHVQQAPSPAGSPAAPIALPSPHMTNGHRSPMKHEEQHRYAHQQAVSAAGGHHPGHHSQYPHHSPNGSNRPEPYSPYRTNYAQPPPPHFQPLPPFAGQQSQQLPQQNGRPHDHSTSAKFGGSSFSPSKPAQAREQSSMPAHSPNHLAHSPKSTLPPPAYSYQQGVQAPSKFSPPPPRPTPQHGYPLGTAQPPNLLQTPQQPRPQSSSSSSIPAATPAHAHPSPAGANSNAVAADGMSGPWPQSSSAIPQKHDQSATSPVPNDPFRENRVLPPVASLIPSPSQQNAASGPQAIPIKKLPNANGSN